MLAERPTAARAPFRRSLDAFYGAVDRGTVDFPAARGYCLRHATEQDQLRGLRHGAVEMDARNLDGAGELGGGHLGASSVEFSAARAFAAIAFGMTATCIALVKAGIRLVENRAGYGKNSIRSFGGMAGKASKTVVPVVLRLRSADCRELHVIKAKDIFDRGRAAEIQNFAHLVSPVCCTA